MAVFQTLNSYSPVSPPFRNFAALVEALSHHAGPLCNSPVCFAADIDKLCSSIVSVFQQVLKPSVDACVYLVKLTQSIGLQGPGTMLGYLVASGLFLTWLRRPTTRFTSVEQSMEGEYRFVHSRLLAHAEEVAFYGGGTIERNTMQNTFDALIAHVRKGQQFRYAAGFVDSIVAKYAATLVGLLIISRPFLSNTDADGKAVAEGRLSKRDMERYYASARMLLNLSSAMGRLILAGRELARLAGFTARVAQLDLVLDSLSGGTYHRQFVTPQGGLHAQQLGPDTSMEPITLPKRPSAANTTLLSDGVGAATLRSVGSGSLATAHTSASPDEHHFHRGFTVYKDDIIAFDRVPLVTPNNDVLVPELTFEVPLGSNVLVAGPNGCGKSSLFRILGGLWPLPGGTLTKPSSAQVFYIPQRPYLSLGTLRDQVLYPHTRAQAAASGVTDQDILELLDTVQLRHLLSRYATGRKASEASPASDAYGTAAWAASPSPLQEAASPGGSSESGVDLTGLDAVQDWKDVLSGGEKQRVGMARVFYHRPLFVVNDEATSQVSADAEGAIYARCKQLGMTLFTVSHRRSLWRWHEYLLRFDGEGGYDFRAMTGGDREVPFGS
jgi:ATP-binding cassette subfamily D (ALD) protein 3